MSGVANWAKQLAFVAETQGAAVRLLHMHQKTDAERTPSTHYLSHRMLQDWLAAKLRHVTGGRFLGVSLRWPDGRAKARRLSREWDVRLLDGEK